MKLCFGILAAITSVIAQTTGISNFTRNTSCGTQPGPEAVLEMESNFAVLKAASGSALGDPQNTTTITVYFHVIHRNGTGNVSDTQIADQLNFLNSAFVNTSFAFELGGTTRNDRSDWFDAKFPAEDEMRDKLRKGGADSLNIYTVGTVTDSGGGGGGIFGYGSFPDSYNINPKLDAVTIMYDTLPGGAIQGYNLGRIVTHEVGHWFGLLHTFEGGCDDPGDLVDDTPPEAIPGDACQERSTCPGGRPDPIHNFMDYTVDSCLTEFTPGQVSRMRSQFDTYRRQFSLIPP